MAQTARALKEQEKTAQKAYADVQQKLRSLMELVRAGGPALEVIRDRLIENHEAQQPKTKLNRGRSR